MAERVIGEYRLIRLLGQGSFGDVYLGEHVVEKYQVAVKVLQTRLTADDLKEFINETSTIFRMKHPHIVQLLDFGVDDNNPFLVMSYAANGTLRQRHPKGTRLPLAMVVTYVKQIAAALQYAHDKKRVHRDVKPDNILLGANDELFLSDFGIAVVAHNTRSLLLQGQGGTLQYIAPEQLRGQARPASDQYALGIMVYEWLGGERPFGGTATEIAMQHLVAPPPLLHEKIPTIPPEVEQVVMQALAKDPKQRFASVQTFAEALERACQTKPPKPGGTRLLTYRGHSDGVYTVAWSPDGRWLASGSEDKTVQVWEANTGTKLTTYAGHSGTVMAVAWSPDGRWLASGSYNGMLDEWETSTGRKLLTYAGHSGPVNAVAWSPDGRWLASSSGSRYSHWDRTVQVWEASTGRELLTYAGHSGPVNALTWSPDGRWLASGSEDKTVQVWEANTGTKLTTYVGHSSYVYAVAWSPDGKWLASGSLDKAVQVWDASRGMKLCTYAEHSAWVSTVAWSPDGRWLASGSDDHTVHVWDASTGTKFTTYVGHSDWVKAVVWSPDGTRIASASGDGTVQVWWVG